MLLELAIILIFCCVLFYAYLTWNFKYWKTRGIPSLDADLLFGNVANSFLGRRSIAEDYADIYNKFEGCGYGGFFRLRQPAIIVRDLELVKSVLIKDFPSFKENDFQVSEKADPMIGKNPFVLSGNKWKLVRSQLSAGFTSGKMRNMFDLIRDVCNNMLSYMDNDPELTRKEGTEVKDLTAKFTTDVVATCAFGLQGNSFTDPNAQFRQMGRHILAPTMWNQLQHLGIIFFPFIANIFGFRFIPKTVADWFQKVINDTVEYRDQKSVSRNDFLQLLMQLKEKSTEYEFTNEHVAAHAVTFFTDGFETSSTAIALALYELAHNPEMQDKLQAEVDHVMDQHGGKLNYDALMEMTYLDAVLSESMRKYPPLAFLGKICTTPFKLPSADGKAAEVEVQVGTSVVISVLGIHRDANNYPDPLKFDPDRFTEEEKAKRHKCAYIPFSEGPRICLGIKLALIQMKAGLATIMSSMTVRTCARTAAEPEFVPGLLFSVPSSVWLRFQKRRLNM